MTTLTRIRTCSRTYTNPIKIISKFSTASDENIAIPKRIPRGPTDILRALDSTISRDPTAAHYKYHDDPYFIPKSNVGKRTFALAQEAGRKAALWARQENADLFQHTEADPPIEKFYPKVTYNDKSDVTEEDLKHVIDNALVSEAQIIYKLLREKNIPISKEVNQSLLELVCYCNGEDPLSEDLIEERWFRQSNKGKERTRKTWNDGGFAEEIFISIENPDSSAYSAIIKGMAKYYQVDRAGQLFEEAQQKGIALNTDAFNAMIDVSNFLKENYDMRWTLIFNLLTQMEKENLKPNLGTLNAVLHSLSTMGGGRSTKLKTFQTLSEFKQMNIEPSLASWYFVLTIFCKERGPTSTILNDIMNEIEEKKHTIRDHKDTSFFVTAMDVCRNHLRDLSLADRVNALLNFGNNYDLIGDSFKESIYYRHYFSLACIIEPLDEFMIKYYEKYVPHIYIPEPAVISDILNQVEANGAVEYVPRLWSDMVTFDHAGRQNLIEQTLSIMINNEPTVTADLIPKCSYIAWDVYERIDKQPSHKINKVRFSGEMVGNILILLLWNNDYEKACQVFEKLDKGDVVGVPSVKALSLFIDHCITQKSPSKALACIQYCADSGFAEASTFAARLNEKLTLDERYLNELGQMIGDPALLLKTN